MIQRAGEGDDEAGDGEAADGVLVFESSFEEPLSKRPSEGEDEGEKGEAGWAAAEMER